jgi:hypothetical protein
MSPRPYPTQNTLLDERTFRQLVREMAPAGRAVDKDDLARAFAESNQRSWAIVLRRAALDWVMENMADRFIVRPGFAEELRAYFDGTGELPDDAAAIRGEDQLARRFKRAQEPADVVVVGRNRFMGAPGDREQVREELAARAHEGKPDEEGRYPGQEARGRFARAGDSSFEPDSR